MNVNMFFAAIFLQDVNIIAYIFFRSGFWDNIRISGTNDIL